MLAGASVGPCPEITVRKRLYKIYRYLTLVHAMTYKNSSHTLSHMDYEIDFVDKLGLLTPVEAYDLASADNMPQKHVCTWLTSEIQMLLRMKDVMSEHTGLQIASLLAECRSLCSKHNGKRIGLVKKPEKEERVTLCLFFYPMIAFTLTQSTFSLFVTKRIRSLRSRQPQSLRFFDDNCGKHHAASLHCRIPIRSDGSHANLFSGLPAVQPLVMVGVFVQTFAIRSAYGLLIRLVDSLLASTDRSTFVHLRAMFCGATVQDDEFDVEKGYHSKENLRIEALFEGDMSGTDLSCSTAKTTHHHNGLAPQTPWSRPHQSPRKRPALPKGASVVLHNRELLIPGLEMRAEI